MSYIADASVVLRWVIPGEEHEDIAIKLRDDYAKGTIELYAPSLLTYEVSNGLWKAVGRCKVSLEDAVSLLDAFLKIAPKDISLKAQDVRRALEIAVTDHISFYDASYIAVAMRTESVLVTTDLALHRVAKKHVRTMQLEDY